MKDLWERYPFLKINLEEFESYLNNSLKARQPLISKAVVELIKAGGKRLRPALVFASAYYGKTTVDVLSVAASIEIMHMATLVHDDIIDEAKLHRGVQTIQLKYGKDIAVFTGDYLFAQSFLLLSGEANTEMLQRVAKGVKLICEGEVDQYQNRYNLDVSLLKYFRRIRRKTAILFQVSCFFGAYQGKLKKKQQYILSKYGKYLGMAFQITDDILDVSSSEEIAGKPVGNDFLEELLDYIVKRNY
ncbi:MAG: polyprenyl synthetase family protein [Halanaerobiales bacterium]|nr:polyprenyl synthetase family protein [Halanaerobiales bacterium]